ncbi:hypothetical protein GUJ93_ZPchr0002g23382 [Zizania palustris]|uniref:Uncharacterized protein n=1 Tax=Zizania palustris TaxID=103762 RepID=A0A8J5VW41_ZIZPA|nr:hypothetical protein GUJ93_ZPchr0002g23382 [Zizania palustris]
MNMRGSCHQLAAAWNKPGQLLVPVEANDNEDYSRGRLRAIRASGRHCRDAARSSYFSTASDPIPLIASPFAISPEA